MSEDDWWTVDQVAAYLGVGPSTVTSYRARGQMPAPDRYFGRTPVWRAATIRTWHEGRPSQRPEKDGP